MQTVPITTNIVSSNPPHTMLLDTTLGDKVSERLAADQWFSPGTPVSSIDKTDRHDITEILLDFYSASSLKQQSMYRQVAPLGHIIPIPSQLVFALSL